MGGSNALLRLVIALEDKASAGLKGIQSALGGIASGASGAASGFASFLSGAAQFAVGGLIQKGIEGIAGSIGALKDGMIGGNAQFETYGKQFEVLLGNADAAKQRLSDLAQFGASTPFELPEVVRADKILQGFGLHAEDAAARFGRSGAEIRRIAGDTASGSGASFEEMAGYIGKFASGATGEAISRFQELGIVTRAQLQAAFDKLDESQAARAKMASLSDEIGRTQATIASLSGNIDMTSAALKANSSALEGAKGAYAAIKDQVGNLESALSDAQRQLSELARPKLAGMEEFDSKLFDLQQQANKAKLAMIGLEKNTPAFDMAQANLDAINQSIDKLGLERDIQFAPQLRAIEQAVKGGTTPAMTFDEVMAQIAAKKDDIARLTGQLGSATATMQTQAGVVSGLEAEHDRLAQTLDTLKGSLGDNKDMVKQLQAAFDAAEKSLIHFDKGGALVIQGQEDLDKATSVLLAMMEQKYGGMMQAQSATFEGMASNLQDWKSATLRTLGEPIFDVVKTRLADLLAWLPSTQPQIESFAQGLAQGLGKGIDWLTTTAIPALQAGWAWLTDTGLPAARAGFDTVGQALQGPLMAGWGWLTGTALPGLQTGWAWLTDTGLPAARAGFEDVAGRVSAALQPALDWLSGTGLPAVQGGLSQLRDILQPLLEALQPVIDGFKEGGLQGALAALPGALPDVLSKLQDLRTELTALAVEGLGGLLTKAADMPQVSQGLASLGLSGPAVDAVTTTLRSMGDVLSTVGGWVRDVGQWFKDDLLPPVERAGAGFAEMLMPHLSRLSEIVSQDIMPILGDLGRFLGDNLPGALGVVSPLVEGLVDTGLSGLELALKAIAAAWNEVLKPAFEAIGGWLERLTGGWDNLAAGAEKVKGTFAAISGAIQDVANGKVDFSQIARGAQNLVSGNIQLPGFAGGVRNFGGGLALVGERGPEVVNLPGGSDVIPNGAFGGGGGGGGVTVVVNVQGSVTTERDLAESIRRQLIEIGRANITAGIP